MLVLRFKGRDYNSITRQIFNVGFRFLKQPYTKISKNMKKNIKFFNYLFRKFIEFIKIKILIKTNIINYIKINMEFTDFITFNL